jgi:hypothetical protein
MSRARLIWIALVVLPAANLLVLGHRSWPFWLWAGLSWFGFLIVLSLWAARTHSHSQ